jgi:hypothetical protein
VAIAALCLSGPVFNTQLGIQFWALTAALFGAGLRSSASEEDPIEVEAHDA